MAAEALAPPRSSSPAREAIVRAAPCLGELAAKNISTRPPPVTSGARPIPQMHLPQETGCVAIRVRLGSNGAVEQAYLENPQSMDPTIGQQIISISKTMYFFPPLGAEREFGFSVYIHGNAGAPDGIFFIDDTGIISRTPVPSPTSDDQYAEHVKSCREVLSNAPNRMPLPKIKSFAPGVQFYPPVLKRFGVQGCVVLDIRIN
jgi:hypothetical protein